MRKSEITSNPDKIYKNPMRLYKVLVKCLTGVIKLFFRLEVKGIENMPQSGSCLVCGNHISNWDPVFMAISVKRPVFFMGKKELFKIPLLNTFLRAVGAFPVDRENIDFTSVKTAISHIKYENALGIFPQGTRCIGKSPSALPIKNGIGLITFKTQADVVPISIYTKNYRVSLFKKVYINIGKPIEYSEYGEVERSPEGYQKVSDIIFGKICELAKESEEASKK